MSEYNPVAEYIMDHAKARNKAVTSKQIGDALMLTGATVRRYVNNARCAGITICSNGKGYFYSTDEIDIKETVRHLQSRVSKINASISGLTGKVEPF